MQEGVESHRLAIRTRPVVPMEKGSLIHGNNGRLK